MAIQVTLKIGPDPPPAATDEIIRTLQEVEVMRGNTAPAGFQLTFRAVRYDPLYEADEEDESKAEWPLLKDDTLAPFNRVQLSVQIEDGDDTVLMDGFITRQEINVNGDGSTIVLTGEDLSVKMDLFEISAEYQELRTSAVVKKILGQYSSIGLTPDVTAPDGESAPTDYVPQQNCSDRFYLQILAAQNGFEFYVQPGESAGDNTAYWGPPVANQSPVPDSQTALISQMQNRDNVESISLAYDALAPTLAFGQVLDLSKTPAESAAVAIGSATQKPSLSTGGAIPSSPAGSGLAQDPTTFSSDLKNLAVRGRISNYPGHPLAEAKQLAQAKTNRSINEVVTIQGELDAARYGEVLRAPGLVDVLGIGDKYGGTFAVKEVTHSLKFEDERWQYRQKFTLTRGGLGYKTPPAPGA